MSVIGTNPSALNAGFYLNIANEGLTKSIKHLSSGNKLSTPESDAAGVAVSSKLDAAVRRLGSASDGAQNLISYAQAADGFLKTIQDQLTRMSELAQRATNGAFSASDRANYNVEYTKLAIAITNQITNARFNGTLVFDTTQTIATAVNDSGSNSYSLTIADATANVSAVTGTTITTTALASSAIGQLTTALENIATSRARVNADVSALSFYVQNIVTEKNNIEAANSRIRDTDFASESTQLAKYNVLTQSAVAMLAQANTSQQNVLTLLR